MPKQPLTLEDIAAQIAGLQGAITQQSIDLRSEMKLMRQDMVGEFTTALQAVRQDMTTDFTVALQTMRQEITADYKTALQVMRQEVTGEFTTTLQTMRQEITEAFKMEIQQACKAVTEDLGEQITTLGNLIGEETKRLQQEQRNTNRQVAKIVRGLEQAVH